MSSFTLLHFVDSWGSTCQSHDLGLDASLTWSCRPNVTVFLADSEVLILNPCHGTCTWSQARGRRGCGRAAAGARASHMISDWLQA